MGKDIERGSSTHREGLVSLPFDLKFCSRRSPTPISSARCRELAAATVVHVITPKDGNVEAPLRFTEDVVQVRLALAKVAAEGGEGAPAFRERFAEDYARFDEELKLFRQTLGDDIVDWLDSRWGSLLKAVYPRRIAMFVDDEEVGTFLYDEGLRFGTLYPITRSRSRAREEGATVRGPPRAEARSGQAEDHVITAPAG